MSWRRRHGTCPRVRRMFWSACVNRGTGVPSLLLSTCSPLGSRIESANSVCVALKKKSCDTLPLLFFRCWRTPDKSWLRPTCSPMTRSPWTTRSKKVWLLFILRCSLSLFFPPAAGSTLLTRPVHLSSSHAVSLVLIPLVQWHQIFFFLLPFLSLLSAAYSHVVENTAFFGDVALRFPRIVHHYFDRNSEWGGLLRWGLNFCNQTGVFTGGAHQHVLTLVRTRYRNLSWATAPPAPFEPGKSQDFKGCVLFRHFFCNSLYIWSFKKKTWWCSQSKLIQLWIKKQCFLPYYTHFPFLLPLYL